MFQQREKRTLMTTKKERWGGSMATKKLDEEREENIHKEWHTERMEGKQLGQEQK